MSIELEWLLFVELFEHGKKDLGEGVVISKKLLKEQESKAPKKRKKGGSVKNGK